MSDATNNLKNSQNKLSEVEQANNNLEKTQNKLSDADRAKLAEVEKLQNELTEEQDAQGKLFEVEQANEAQTNAVNRDTEVREEIPAEYEVKKGDTVYTIAHKYGLTQGKVISLNNIEDPRALKVGQKLKLRG